MTQDRPRLMTGKTQAGVLTPILMTASGKIQTEYETNASSFCAITDRCAPYR